LAKTVKSKQPCPCGQSSDGAVLYDNGWGRCFSGKCGGKNFKWDEDTLYPEPDKDTIERPSKAPTIEEIKDYDSKGISERRLIKPVAEFYGIKVSVNSDGVPDRYFYPFVEPGNNAVVGYKTKKVGDKKATYAIGKINNLFGIEHFRNGGQRIIITEGEEDCWAIQTANYLKYKKFYPVISMGGASQTDYLLKERDTLTKFKEVILWFDNDKEGQLAVDRAAKIVGYDRVKVVISDHKDANDTLLSEEAMNKAVDKTVYLALEAKGYNPSGIVSGEDTWEAYKSFKGLEFVPWPPFLSKLNELTYGRALGSITMFPAGTGVGKSSLMREDIFHIINTTDAKVGACFLEEGVGETVSAMMSLALNKRIGLPGVELTDEEERGAWERTLGTGRIMLVDHQGSVSDSGLIDKLEYLAASGCKYIYLDHITIAVSEADGDNINAAIDKFMNRLLQLVQRYGVWVGVVSHLRKVKSGEESFESGARVFEDDLKGSGSLKQVSFQTIALSRNKLHEDETKRHTTQVWLLKDRKTGNTGPAGAYRFDGKTGRLVEVDLELMKMTTNDEIEIIGA
jgi:twinkle protein